MIINKKNNIITIFVMAALTFSTLPGCKTTLEEGGPYKGDTLLYRAELASVTSYELMNTFVKWEHDNRNLLSTHPEIKVAADRVRTEYPKVKAGLDAAIEVYRQLPNDENKAKLSDIIKVVQTEVAKVSKYMNP
ncbi:hypothetical protein [Ereboglobus luteus]|uniref:Uncharacterized protein n=1 Tax=Ereboglobus luteus TaxID=1796921 RepID=A0A2U8E626_9BACT|nr:hypothetical protein [Ereboglobus luteus]AWI10323.1 hypothetical protein CKA38_14615 [Ereboglobus luteus]